MHVGRGWGAGEIKRSTQLIVSRRLAAAAGNGLIFEANERGDVALRQPIAALLAWTLVVFAGVFAVSRVYIACLRLLLPPFFGRSVRWSRRGSLRFWRRTYSSGGAMTAHAWRWERWVKRSIVAEARLSFVWFRHRAVGIAHCAAGAPVWYACMVACCYLASCTTRFVDCMWQGNSRRRMQKALVIVHARLRDQLAERLRVVIKGGTNIYVLLVAISEFRV